MSKWGGGSQKRLIVNGGGGTQSQVLRTYFDLYAEKYGRPHPHKKNSRLWLTIRQQLRRLADEYDMPYGEQTDLVTWLFLVRARDLDVQISTLVCLFRYEGKLVREFRQWSADNAAAIVEYGLAEVCDRQAGVDTVAEETLDDAMSQWGSKG